MINAKDCDLLITYSHHTSKYLQLSHKLCGHIFECLEYYWLLKDHFKVKVLFSELSKEFIKDLINKRYNVEFNFDDFIFVNRPNLICSKNILLTDGGYWFPTVCKLIGNKIAFGCGSSFIKSYEERPKDFLFLEDHRVYSKSPNWKNINSINYIKKINTKIMKIPESFINRPFAYVTENCRSYNVQKLIDLYPDIIIFSDYLNENYNITNKPLSLGDFNKFIYTPTPRHFDCSPRLIAECDFLGLPVDYIDIDYEDPGLEARRLDIKNNDYHLKDDDPIIDILKNNLV